MLEADLKNFFGSLGHEWLLRFVEHRVGDPRLISLIRRWLKAGVLEDGVVHPSEKGTPQGGSISVLLSNVYLHYVLDLWFERVVKPRLRGEASWCDTSTTLWCVSNIAKMPSRPERFVQTAGKVRLNPGTDQDQARRIWSIRAATREQARQEAPGDDLLSGLHAVLHAQPERQLQGWDAHREVTLAAQPDVTAGPDAANTALAGPGTSGQSQHRVARPLCLLRHRREYPRVAEGVSGGGALLAQDALQPESAGRLTWDVFHQIKERVPLLRPKLYLPYRELQALAVL